MVHFSTTFLSFTSLGCDSKAITNLLCTRTNSQRQKIELEYKTMYGRVRHVVFPCSNVIAELIILTIPSEALFGTFTNDDSDGYDNVD